MRYGFKEGELPSNFRNKDIQQIKKLIYKSTSFTIVGMPGVGISSFLKYLVCKDFAYFVHIDLYELHEFSRKVFFSLFLKELNTRYKCRKKELLIDLIKKGLNNLTLKHERVVVVFNRFDQMKTCFDANFFLNLRSLVEVNKEKIIFIFSSNRTLYDWSPDSFKRINLEIYSHNHFLKPYTHNELVNLCKLNIPNCIIPSKLLILSGGHLQLLKLLVSSGRKVNFLEDDYICLQLRRIYEESLNERYRLQLQKVVFNRDVKYIESYLFRLGLVKRRNNISETFSPLFTQYVNKVTTKKLTKLELRLLKMLEDNIGEVVKKDNIFETLWKNNPDKQSDWSLNALIYRLRRKSAFIDKRYLINSHKKIGYSLSKL